jgi:hypothetical protein
MTKKQYRWHIFLIRATPATRIGRVEEPDAASAIKKAIEVFEITDPQKQKRDGRLFQWPGPYPSRYRA